MSASASHHREQAWLLEQRVCRRKHHRCRRRHCHALVFPQPDVPVLQRRRSCNTHARLLSRDHEPSDLFVVGGETKTGGHQLARMDSSVYDIPNKVLHRTRSVIVFLFEPNYNVTHASPGSMTSISRRSNTSGRVRDGEIFISMPSRHTRSAASQYGKVGSSTPTFSSRP